MRAFFPLFLALWAGLGCQPPSPATPPPSSSPTPSAATPAPPAAPLPAELSQGTEAPASAPAEVGGGATTYEVVAYSQDGREMSSAPPKLRVEGGTGRLRVHISGLNTYCAPQPAFAVESRPASRSLALHLLPLENPSRCVGAHTLTLEFPLRAEGVERVELLGADSETLASALRAGLEPADAAP